MSDAMARPPSDQPDFPPGDSACAKLIRSRDWSGTGVGAPAAWPAALRLPVAMVVNAGSATALFWGADHVLIYNDAYADLLGDRHPEAFGQPARDLHGSAWTEIAALLDGVMGGGPARMLADLRVRRERSGVPEDAWFTFEFSPIFDAAGQVCGVLSLCSETTREVAVERRDAFRLELETRVRGLTEPAAMGQGVIDALCNLIEVEDAAFGQSLDGGDLIRVTAGHGDGVGRPDVVLDLALLGPRATATLRTAATFVCDDLAREPGADLAALGFAACVCVPAVRDGAFRGAFLLGRRERRRWSLADISLSEEVTGLVWEVLARAQVQSALTTTQAHWRGLFERLHEGLVVGEVVRDDADARAGWRVVDMNPAFEQLSGLEQDAAVGQLASDILPQDDLGWADAALAVLRTGEPASFTCQLGRQRRWFEGHAFGAGGDQFAVLFLDVTDRRRAEAALQESEDHYRHVVELDPQATWTARPDGVIERVTPRWSEWTGGDDPGAIVGAGVHGDDVARTREAWAHCVATGEPFDIEHRVRMRDGAYRWMHSRAFARRDATGAIARWYGATEDIDDRRLAQQLSRDLNETLESQVAERTAALLVSQAQLRAIFETSYQYQGLLDLDGRLLDSNATSLKGADTTLEEVKGQYLWDTPWFSQTPGLQPLIREAVADAANGLATRRELVTDTAGGERVFDFSIRPVRDSDGRPVALVPEAVEITERRRAEQALRQSQKMEAVGQLTGGIAHDFNNMLAVVIGSLDLLGRRIGVADARARRYVDAATEAARRAALLTQRLLAFSRQQPLTPRSLDVNQLIEGLSDLIHGSVGSDVQVEAALADDLWRVHVDANQLENVLLNLAVNARDAMPQGGRLLLATANARLDGESRAVQSGAPVGAYVRISVGDTGSGMSPDVIARAFDPFFTTKEVGKGTGLGLSQVYGFVTQSGGHVDIRSELRQGTTVNLFLPRFDSAPAELGEVQAEALSPSLARRRELVLVVEDEAAVRQVSVDALGELGYAVLAASGAAEALRLIEAHPDIDLLFTDAVMPQVSGRKLAQAARRLRPDLKVLFTTGYSRDANGQDAEQTPLIAKPFTLEELAARVRESLD